MTYSILFRKINQYPRLIIVPQKPHFDVLRKRGLQGTGTDYVTNINVRSAQVSPNLGSSQRAEAAVGNPKSAPWPGGKAKRP